MSCATEMSVLYRPPEPQQPTKQLLLTQGEEFPETVSHSVPDFRPVPQFNRAPPPPEPQLLKDLRSFHARLEEAIQSGSYDAECNIEQEIEKSGVFLFDTVPSKHSEYFLTLSDVDQRMVSEFGNLHTPEWVILFCSLNSTDRTKLYSLEQRVHRLEYREQKIVRYYRVFPESDLAQLAVFTALPTKERLLIEKGRQTSSQYRECQTWYSKLSKDHKKFASDFSCSGTNVQTIAKEYRNLSSAEKKYVCAYSLMAYPDKNFICNYTSLSVTQIGHLKALLQLPRDVQFEVLHDLNPKVQQTRSQYQDFPYYQHAITCVKDDIHRLRYPDVFDEFFVIEDVNEDTNKRASP